MSEKLKDITIPVLSRMSLAIKEMRDTSTSYSRQTGGFDQVEVCTKTRFHWQLKGIASKVPASVVQGEGFKPEDQELYDIQVKSRDWNFGFYGGFETREAAVLNAMQFAKRNGIEVDGYCLDAEQRKPA